MPVTAQLVLIALAVDILWCGCAGPTCGPSEAIVDRVIDGDTIVITGGQWIRYLGIDAPETTGGRDDCYGRNAARFNADRVLGKAVALDYGPRCEDRYGRTLAYVAVGGQDVGRVLVERGYACALHIPPDGDERADEFKAHEAAARSDGRGLWSACDPIPCN